MSAATQVNEKSTTLWAWIIALVIVAALVVAFLTLGVAGIGLVMVGITPVMYVILILISRG